MTTTGPDRPREACGIIGIYAPHEDVARMAFFGLFALQHRGQEAAGIAVSDGRIMNLHKDVGMVSQVFTPVGLMRLDGHFAIGHTRYSTTGSPSLRNAQPLMIETVNGPIALAHNGNLVNSTQLRTEMMHKGVGFTSTSDSEVLAMMLACDSGNTWEARIKTAMQSWVGAYSLVLLTLDCIYAVRDPWGFRPLSVGMLPSGGYAAASETGALRTLGCEALREVKPGEIVTMNGKALRVQQALPAKSPSALCVFESIYFSRPDAIWDGRSVHHVRQNLGRELVRECPTEADTVIPVPDSAIPAAIGFATESRIPYNDGFIKNRYIGRTFIEPTDSLRKQGVALKINVINENVVDKRIVMIDDSIVRGNTTGPIVRLLKNAGAREVHVRITCPPIRHPCFMGVDMGTVEDLVAHQHSVDEICELIEADSLHYLSLDGLMKAIGRRDGYCQACFTGEYPIPVDLANVKTGFEHNHNTSQEGAPGDNPKN